MNRGTHGVVALYLAATGLFVLLFRDTLAHPWALGSLHLVGALVAFAAAFGLFSRTGAPQTRGAAAILRDWYPLLLFPLLYKEVELFARAFGNWTLTARLQQVDTVLFFGQPSLYLSERLPYVALSEFLHFCYLSYLLWIPVIGGTWYFTGKRNRFHELLFLVSVTYALSYLFYMIFPVDSPFYLLPPPGRPLEGHFFYDLVHFVSSRGGARGGAFPSSHVSVSTVVLLVVLRYERRWAVWLVPVYGGLVLATVYGRFHYGVDVLAGFALAFVVVFAYRLRVGGPGVSGALENRRDPHAPSDAEGDDGGSEVAAL